MNKHDSLIKVKAYSKTQPSAEFKVLVLRMLYIPKKKHKMFVWRLNEDR